jgi:hypothetical protein
VIYFVQHVRLSTIKIGWTRNLNRRLVGLRAEAGSAVRVLAVMSGTRFDETAIHDYLSRCQAAGEWFWPMEPVLRFIARKARRWDGSDDIVDRRYPEDSRLTWGRHLVGKAPEHTTEPIRPMRASSHLQFGYPMRVRHFYGFARASS